ncbi:sensor histidine kinase KdpD [Mesorhizobium sp. STM 4661]|uniref:sensor histidine kinase n=1 Tax=Mesorhizobium sp. STM 4661 TaxID=1297570 RepID=UPI0002BD4F9B|nr:sensor histidine kinase KdpD [Mesorhizobium sp. STM 4661]CCV16198.1 fused sensory histidine kinase in two-component regulatory system with KdpE: signal sensing protein; sensory histidine kinase [Mesorhizobium sp. STM 4661]
MPEDRSNVENRPSPDALLDHAEREERGRLRIFLGAAPGVGKTYEMLMSGRARRADGMDVVIGIVETHGRKETQALVEGFEVIPRSQVDYKGRMLDEMDIDAILARRPALVLVDELAHTNAPGSRHPKRYLDVQEILTHGIDVYTTLNVQHVESLNDVVAQITHVRVRETVPDSIIDQADDIEIIDLTPDDLIKRLKEGKVYFPNTAQRAIENYFSPGNLTALRELALRRTAQRVDEQLLNHMQAHAIPGPWAAGERVLVCVDARPGGAARVRYARRLADRLRAPWTALHVDTPRLAAISEEDKDRLATLLRLAEQLGAEVTTIPGQNVAQDIVRHATANNFTHIVIGRPTRSRWRELIEGSLTYDLIRNAGDISVHVISGTDRGTDAASRSVKAATEQTQFQVWPYLLATAYVAGSLGVSAVLDQFLDVRNLAIVFLLAVLTSAVTCGLWPALYACLISALAFNYFFLEPRYTLTIRDPESFVALAVFLVVAVIASNLTARVQRQAVAARSRARATEDIYLFSKKLAGAGTLDDVLWATAFQIASMLKLRVVLLLPENGSITVKAGYPPDDTLAEADIAAARWAWEHDRPAGRGADTLPGAKRLYLPLRTGRTAVGVVGLDNDKQGPLLTPEQQRLLDALADQAAVAIERIQLVADVDRAKLAAEADRLRSALLTSISHDLKTPLAAIMGAAGTLREFAPALPEQDRVELLSTVLDESERLNRFIANLLDMTKIESGAMEPNYAFHYVGDIVGSALQRAKKIISEHKTEIDIPQNLPMLKLDPVLFEQVLFNLLDNAAKYAPAESTIRMRAWVDNGTVTLQIMDEGPGIPPADLERIFDTFYRVRKRDQVRAGTGLGLSICRGFIEAMGGTISAANRTDRSGAVFTIRMPVPTELPPMGDQNGGDPSVDELNIDNQNTGDLA